MLVTLVIYRLSNATIAAANAAANAAISSSPLRVWCWVLDGGRFRYLWIVGVSHLEDGGAPLWFVVVACSHKSFLCNLKASACCRSCRSASLWLSELPAAVDGCVRRLSEDVTCGIYMLNLCTPPAPISFKWLPHCLFSARQRPIYSSAPHSASAIIGGVTNELKVNRLCLLPQRSLSKHH